MVSFHLFVRTVAITGLRPETVNSENTAPATPVHRVVRVFGHDDSSSHRRSLPMYSIRIAVGDPAIQFAVGIRALVSSVAIRTRRPCVANSWRRLSCLRSLGVGLFRSVESTAHQSNRDIKCESQETEVPRNRLGALRAHQSNRVIKCESKETEVSRHPMGAIRAHRSEAWPPSDRQLRERRR